MKRFDGLEFVADKLFWRVAMKGFVVALCMAAGLVMTGSGAVNAAAPTSIGSAAEHQIRIPVKEDPRDDWIPWDRVIRVFNSKQECITAGQALADAKRGQYHCQQAKSGAWVLFK